jgi:hypothetical protein
MTLGLSSELEVVAHIRDIHPGCAAMLPPATAGYRVPAGPRDHPEAPDQGRFRTDAQNYRGEEARGAPDRRLATPCGLE